MIVAGGSLPGFHTFYEVFCSLRVYLVLGEGLDHVAGVYGGHYVFFDEIRFGFEVSLVPVSLPLFPPANAALVFNC